MMLPASPRSSAQRSGWEWLTFLVQRTDHPTSYPVREPAGLRASHTWIGKPRKGLCRCPEWMAQGTVTSGSM